MCGDREARAAHMSNEEELRKRKRDDEEEDNDKNEHIDHGGDGGGKVKHHRSQSQRSGRVDHGKNKNQESRLSYERFRSPTTREDSEAGSIDDSVGHYYGNPGTMIRERCKSLLSLPAFLPPFLHAPLTNDLIDRIEKEIGCGTFGKVFDCLDTKHNQNIAIKVVRNIPKYVDSAKIEARILDEIYRHQKRSNTSGCVKLYSHFHYEGWRSLDISILMRN